MKKNKFQRLILPVEANASSSPTVIILTVLLLLLLLLSGGAAFESKNANHHHHRHYYYYGVSSFVPAAPSRVVLDPTKLKRTAPTATTSATATQLFLFGDNNKSNNEQQNNNHNDDDDNNNTRKPEGISKMQYKLEKLAQKQVPDKQVEELLLNYGEKSRQYRRDVFTSADWIRTRRPDRFVDNLLTIFSSGLIRQISFEIYVLAALSALVVLYNDLFVEGFVDFSGLHKYGPIFGNPLPAMQLPMLPFTLSTAALGLLLTFRTNVSYARWNEARTAWGAVINDSRSIVRMGCIWARSYNNIDDASLQRLGEAVCSFSRTLMNRTLPPQEDGERFRQYTFTALTDQYYAQVLRDSKHRPTAALAEITQIMVDFQLNPIHQVEVERVVTGLCDAMGASERIFTSPVPTFYTRHTARFLAIWLFTLPLGLYAPFASTWNHFAMIPATVALGLFLLGIERLATEMEEPFSILPMEKMCEGSIRTPVMEQVQRSMMGSYKPVTIVEAMTVSSSPLYPAPVKFTTIEQGQLPAPPPPTPQQASAQASIEPPQTPPPPPPLSSVVPERMPQPLPPRPTSFTSIPNGLSDADMAKLSQYFNDVPFPSTLPASSSSSSSVINGDRSSSSNENYMTNNGRGDLTVEEMNQLWASSSGSTSTSSSSHAQSEDKEQSSSSSSPSSSSSYNYYGAGGSYMDSLNGSSSSSSSSSPSRASPTSYMPKKYKGTSSGTGLPSYFDSFNS